MVSRAEKISGVHPAPPAASPGPARPSRTGLSAQLGHWLRHHRHRLGLLGAAVATVLAVVWTVLVPEKAEHVSGIQELAIRWAHPVCWALLAVVGLLVATEAPKRLRDGVAVAAVLCYAAFLTAVLL